jgi:hypothetical protein
MIAATTEKKMAAFAKQSIDWVSPYVRRLRDGSLSVATDDV